MERKIRKVAVLGSGVMGSRIACHFANIGLEVLLLDIVPQDAGDKPAMRNKIVNDALAFALKSNPSPIYNKSFASRIQTGNFDDDLQRIADMDWVIEAVVERLDIKQSLYEKVEKYRKPGTLITSNTSGIPIEMMIKGRSEDFQTHFCGTHFFNPPRYLKLFEIIPSTKTKLEVVEFFQKYADLYLGKVPVLCKDTPAFIANRIGVFSMMSVFHLMDEMDMKIEDIDNLTGSLTGKPKSASFRTSDAVGLDTLIKVAQGVAQYCPNDESNASFQIPEYVNYLATQNFLGDKTGQGFYKKTKNAEGKTEILVFDTKLKDYRKQEKTSFASIGAAKQEENLKKRLQILAKQNDAGAAFLKKLNYKIFAYVTHRIPEIANHLYLIDDAMKAGFGWELGPFETWDVLNVAKTLEAMQAEGHQCAAWVQEMVDAGHTSFYKVENGVRLYYDIATKNYLPVDSQKEFIILDNLRKEKTVWSNSGCNLIDLGDGILNVEFNTKMNAIGGEIMQGIHKAIDLAEQGDFRGIVLGNDAANFSAGANLAMVYMLALEQEYDELVAALRNLQLV